MIGIVANGRSWRNRAGSQAAFPAGVMVEAPETLDGYPAALARLRDSGVTILAVDGGDGTLREVLSAMVPVYGDALPAIALLPSGKTNVAAADVGGAGRGPDAVARLIAAEQAGTLTVIERRPLAIAFDGRTTLGFVFGLGAFERATRLVDERVHDKGFAQKLGVALGVVTSVSAALGNDRADWSRGVALDLRVGEGAPVSGRSFALLATTLHRWVLGLWPFWGAGAGAIALTDVAAPPRRLMRGLLTAGFGRPRPWAEAEGWRSLRADAATLTLEAPFIIDGDRFEPGPDGVVSLSAGPAIRFVRP